MIVSARKDTDRICSPGHLSSYISPYADCPSIEHRDAAKIMTPILPLVDAPRIDSLRRAMPAAAFGRSVKAFRSSLEKRAAEAGEAMAGQRWDDALRVIHSIKGVSGNFGAVRLAAEAADLEAKIADGDHAAALALVAGFQETTRLTLLGLDDALARPGPAAG